MAVDIENNTTSSDDEDAKVKAQSEMQMAKARINDYIAIVIALFTVALLAILQRMGLY
jgi:hypothetical protein